jgi:hypothetical protein
MEEIYTAGFSSVSTFFRELPESAHLKQHLPLVRRDRNYGEPRHTDKSEFGEAGIGFDGGKGNGQREGSICGDVDNGQLFVVGIRIRIAGDSGYPDELLALTRVVDQG